MLFCERIEAIPIKVNEVLNYIVKKDVWRSFHIVNYAIEESHTYSTLEIFLLYVFLKLRSKS